MAAVLSFSQSKTSREIFVKTCTPVGTFRGIPPQGTAAIHVDHAYLKMSESTIICKTQEIVTFDHPIIIRSDAQFKPHKTPRNHGGAVYAAVIVPHWDFLAFAGDRPAIDDVIQGTPRLRWLPF